MREISNEELIEISKFRAIPDGQILFITLGNLKMKEIYDEK